MGTSKACLRRALAGLLLAGGILLQAAAEPAADLWPKIRSNLFAERPISTDAESVITLETPVRAEDAAIVPVSIRTFRPQTPQQFIHKVYLVIDRNPSPVAAVFTFAAESGRADLETRVRVEEYTPIRAIAEMSDGRLFMAERFVKAAGGCSAPAGKDQAAALANLGKMRLRLEPEVRLGAPNIAQLMISHPNHSGLAMDQVSRLYTPAHFVRKVDVRYAGKLVLSAEVDFSISENPNFRFYFVPQEEGELSAEVVDTQDLSFSTRVEVKHRVAPVSDDVR